MKKRQIFAAATVALFLGSPFTVKGEEETSQRILEGVYLENVNLSGMTQEEATQAVDRRMEEIAGYQIQLWMDDQSVGIPASELGVSGDNQKTISQAAAVGQAGNVIKRYKVRKDLEEEPIQLALTNQADKQKVQTALETYCLPLNREVTDYGLTREGKRFQIINGQRGVALDLEKSVSLVADYLENQWQDGNGSLELAVDITEPRGSQEELARVKNILGQGSTDYSSSSAARATNIKNGTSTLNGKVLYPGDSISVCSAMMPFTEENGYELAPSYANGTTVETFGGGICQVSTTLYLAVIRAELEVTERHNHSMIVNYVKPAMDAAIAEGSKDFQFTNNLDAPIYIEGYAAGGSLSFAIYGEEYRPENRKVTFESEILETIDPTVELTADTELGFGVTQMTQGPHIGYRSILWKVVTENGEEVSREEVNNSNYMMSPTKYKVGVKTDNPEASSAMYSAIASNDLNKVYEAAQKY